MTILLGLGSALCWGTADFFGGLQSRHLPALAVALWSQLAGGLALLLVLLVLGGAPVAESIVWGIGGGLFSGVALVLFYRGLAGGIMSIVAPVSACGALVPVAVGLALGEVPGPLVGAGVGAAVVGIVLVSLQTGREARASGSPRSSLVLALGSALGFGMFYVFIDQAAAGAGSPLWSVGGARIGSLAIILLIIAAGRSRAPWPGPRIGPIALIGIFDTTANALFAFATARGELGIAAVLASLYPVATVALGRIVLAERLSSIQAAGVVLTLTGVGLIAAG